MDTDHSSESAENNCSNGVCANNASDSVLGTIILQKYESLQKQTRHYKYNILRLRHQIYNLETENKKLQYKNTQLKEFHVIKWGSIGLNIALLAYIVKLYNEL
jgi:hypothetical protein